MVNFSVAVFVLYLMYALYSAVKLRTNLTLGNGAALATLYLFLTAISLPIFGVYPIEYWKYIIAFIIGYYMLMMAGLIYKIPIINSVSQELAKFFKQIIRIGIPREKVDNALQSAYGFSISELEKKSEEK